MATFKLVISDPKTALSMQREAKDAAASRLVGLKIGDTVKGEALDLAGYEFEITGGSDYSGFPMRKDVQGPGRKRILAVKGVGVRIAGKGIKQRKTVCGNTIHERIAQVNMKVIKEGQEKIFEAKAKEASEKAAARKAEKDAKKAEAQKKPAREKADKAESTEKAEKSVEEAAKKAEEKKEPKEAAKEKPAEKEPKKEPKAEKKE